MSTWTLGDSLKTLKPPNLETLNPKTLKPLKPLNPEP